jgi:hypothetical protein
MNKCASGFKDLTLKQLWSCIAVFFSDLHVDEKSNNNWRVRDSVTSIGTLDGQDLEESWTQHHSEDYEGSPLSLSD